MEYITARGIRYKNELSTIKKSDTALQPIYEAFMNAWEAISEKYGRGMDAGGIAINFYVKTGLFEGKDAICQFVKVSISDNGIGLNEENYNRLVDLRDGRNASLNKGTGRVQFLHFFKETKIESIYTIGNNMRKRSVTLSEQEAFIRNNAILRLDSDEITEEASSRTDVGFYEPNDKCDEQYYAYITVKEVKEDLLKHFLILFCDNRENMPKIHIRKFVNDEIVEYEQIQAIDILVPDTIENFKVKYSKLDENNKVIQTENVENFTLRSFVHSKDMLQKNEIRLVSKGETASNKITLNSLKGTDEIDGKRYLFLLSGSYIDAQDSDDRGHIRLLSEKEFKKQNKDSLFADEVILSEDIVDETNKTIDRVYQNISKKNIETLKNLEELQRMFLLNEESVNAIKDKVRNIDSTEEVLQKIYKSDADIKAKQDARIKEQIDDIKTLDPTKNDYQERLKERINEFVLAIPLQNRTALSQYVARRKMVLDLFDMILNRETENLRNGGRIDEDILHNLIFQQTTENSSPESSDLWLINEEYIYFIGVSDCKLNNISVAEGENLLKSESELSPEEFTYKMKMKKNAGNRRPDILLFPDEGKCIIIEFKAPNVNVGEHLDQINRYASLINNLSQEKYKIQTYYGYLIGENVDIDEIQDLHPDFKSAVGLNYIFRPYLPVIGKFGHADGSLYTEVLRYSDLLERAKLRNKIFIDKLVHGCEQ